MNDEQLLALKNAVQIRAGGQFTVDERSDIMQALREYWLIRQYIRAPFKHANSQEVNQLVQRILDDDESDHGEHK